MLFHLIQVPRSMRTQNESLSLLGVSTMAHRRMVQGEPSRKSQRTAPPTGGAFRLLLPGRTSTQLFSLTVMGDVMLRDSGSAVWSRCARRAAQSSSDIALVPVG